MKSGMEEKNARVQLKKRKKKTQNFLIKNANQIQLEMTDN